MSTTFLSATVLLTSTGLLVAIVTGQLRRIARWLLTVLCIVAALLGMVALALLESQDPES